MKLKQLSMYSIAKQGGVAHRTFDFDEFELGLMQEELMIDYLRYCQYYYSADNIDNLANDCSDDDYLVRQRYWALDGECVSSMDEMM